MINDKIRLEIHTPDRSVYSDEISDVRLPGLKGHFGVYPGHTLMVAALKIGEIKVHVDNSTRYFATSGGLVEVLPNRISVLADAIEAATEIDVERASASQKRAEERLEEKGNWDVSRARVSLMRALNRMKVASRARS